MATFTRFKKPFTKENGGNYACWAHRKNHHTYEKGFITDDKGKKHAVMMCRCGVMMPQKNIVKA